MHPAVLPRFQALHCRSRLRPANPVQRTTASENPGVPTPGFEQHTPSVHQDNPGNTNAKEMIARIKAKNEQ